LEEKLVPSEQEKGGKLKEFSSESEKEPEYLDESDDMESPIASLTYAETTQMKLSVTQMLEVSDGLCRKKKSISSEGWMISW